jgi:ABC-type Fe3+/spermidine/putrescine transport system ATPase subunit
MALEARGLRKRYGGFELRLDFTVADGEILVLAGPSGCGKTTALNLITGLVEADAGELFIDGLSAGALPPWKRNLAVVFQDLALFPHLTVGQNAAYGLFIRGVPRKERKRIAARALKTACLDGFERRRIHTLSGGERQRAAIARALAVSPRALLLDEPFSSLDAPLRRELRGEFRRMLRHSGESPPCVFVTHDREEAAALADRIALMSAGRIVESGSAQELFLAPQTEFAARFWGAGTVWPCALHGQDSGRLIVRSPLGMFSVAAGRCGAGALERPCLFVPLDALSLDGRGVPQRARFRQARFEGTAWVLELELPSGETVTVYAGPRTALPARDSAVYVYVDEPLLSLVRGAQ